jgi:hypothetical protein
MDDMEWQHLRFNFHALKRYNADLLKQVDELAEELERVRSWAKGVEADNATVRKERDEARVTLCIEVAETNCDFRKVVSSPSQVASEYGWDYLISDLEDDMVDRADREFARTNDLPTEPRAEND